MLRTALPVALVAAVAAVAPAQAAAPAASSSASALREFEGTVVSVNRDNRTFRLRDTERGTVRIKVNGRTRYERIDGHDRALELAERRGGRGGGGRGGLGRSDGGDGGHERGGERGAEHEGPPGCG